MTDNKKNKKKEIKISTFELATENFKYNIDCLIFSLPLIMAPLIKEFKHGKNNLDNFLSAKTKKKFANEYLVKIKDWETLENLEKKVRNSSLAIRAVPRGLFISLVSYFDNHLRGLLNIVFEKNNFLLNNTEKKISTSEVLELTSITEVRQYLVNKEIEQLLYDGRKKCFDWLEEKLKIKCNFNEIGIKKFTELTERRNLFVHSDGIVTKQYINICRKNNIPLSKKIKVGYKLELTPGYFLDSCYLCLCIGIELSQALWRKLEENKIEDADTYLLNMTADLLNNDNNLSAGRLLDFSDKLEKVSSEKFKLMFIINRALSMKFGKSEKMAIDLINSRDWSAEDDELKLAVAIIKDDLKEAVKMMLKIGPTKDMKDAYKKDWPLFKEFRKTVLFRKTYKKIFKESFITMDKKEIPFS